MGAAMPPLHKPDLIENARLVDSLRHAVNHCNINHVPQIVTEVLQTGAWRERYKSLRHFRFDNFVNFITGPPFKGGLGWSLDKVRELLVKAGNDEALALWDQETRAKRAQEVDTQTHANQRSAGRPKILYNENDVVQD